MPKDLCQVSPDCQYFYPEQPRRPEDGPALLDLLSADPDWVAEPKYHGNRLQLYYLDGKWQFWNRHGSRMAYVPSPEVLTALNALKLEGLWHFDGELRHNKVKGVRHQIVLFDLFMVAGEPAIYPCFGERRLGLETLIGDRLSGPLSLAPQCATDFGTVFEQFRQDQEIEGLVLKNLRGERQLSPFCGTPSRWMWKVKYAPAGQNPETAPPQSSGGHPDGQRPD
jgi:ATP-dependent DNA ligase